jgi:hypothetical protein
MIISRRDLLRRAANTAGAGIAARHIPESKAALSVEKPIHRRTRHQPQLSRFGRIFSNLPPFRPHADPTVTLSHFRTLAETMPEAADTAIQGADDPAFDIARLGSARTYFGQFIDHDLTKDARAQPSQFFSSATDGLLDPSGAPVYNFETFRFDLSSVYGGGPSASPQLYAADREHFVVVPDNGNGVRDLPRSATGQAVLVEGRNDENQIISQLHLAFLMFHNAVVDLGHSFARARQLTVHYYQWAILHDFLPGWVGQDTVDGVLDGSIPRFYRPDHAINPFTPLEWSVAAYRFGHSVVRNDYELNDTDSSHNIFDGTNNDLHGARLLEAGRQIDWGDFEKPLQSAANTAAGNTQSPRKVDTHISDGLFRLPIGGPAGAEVSGLSSLPERNMIRAYFYGLPSGQEIAKAIGEPVLHPERVIDSAIVPGFGRGTPAWYYMLKEAELAGGDRVGAVGGRIIADVFTALLEVDPIGILNPAVRFVPQPPIAAIEGKFGLADLLVFAGVASRP